MTQKLQAVNLNLLDVQNHVEKILAICQMHRDNAEKYFDENTRIFQEILKLSEQLVIDLVMPRHSSSGQSQDLIAHFRQHLCSSYLDSLTTSLKTSFSDDHASTFKLSCLIPLHLATLSRCKYAHAVAEINDVYSLENFAIESMTWYNYWSAHTQKPANR